MSTATTVEAHSGKRHWISAAGRAAIAVAQKKRWAAIKKKKKKRGASPDVHDGLSRLDLRSALRCRYRDALRRGDGRHAGSRSAS
jgi:hypothetical protein